ncbi:MAG: prephenate dehydrogenase [Myxococcota bacterium]
MLNGRFERIAVIGLGLLGGSVGLASRQRGLAECVAGASRRRDTLEAALRSGAVDEAGDLHDVVRGADLVVLATPIGAMAEVVRRAAPALRADALLTDVGSVKAPLAETLPGLLPRGVCYVGSHPMAGSHRRGLEHARADLFEGAPCVVSEHPDRGARQRVCEFWRALGARVVVREPVLHDAEVAWMSHVPHLLSVAFAGALAGAPPGSGEVAGAGFRDFTRIAHSDPGLWGEILTANAKALAAPLQATREALAELTRAVEAGEAEAVARWIASARSALTLLSPAPPAGAERPAAAEQGEESLEKSPPRGGPERRADNER